MITATDLWRRAIIKIDGQTINRPFGAIELGPEIEETLIHRGYAIAFDPTLKETEISEETKAETTYGPELGQEDTIVEEPEEPLKSTKRTAKK